MEKRINQKTRTYLQQFKNDIKEFVTDNDKCLTKDEANSLLQFIYDYQPLEFQKTDFQKRKRVKNVGHKNAIMQPFIKKNRRQWEELNISTNLMLTVTDMVKNNSKFYKFHL